MKDYLAAADQASQPKGVQRSYVYFCLKKLLLLSIRRNTMV
jgi:hypothetical protein